MAKDKKSYYGKRPLWQWILLYVVVGGIIYAALYYSGIVKLGYHAPAGSTQYNYSK